MKLKSFIIIGILFSSLSTSVNAALFFVIGDVGTIGGSNNWPSGELPEYAADGSVQTKYMNFGKTNTGYIFTPSAGSTIVSGINFTTANDGSDRDPASYILWGSNTATASMTAGAVFDVENYFTKISEGVLTLPSGRLESGGDVTFTNTTAYNTYLLVFPTVKNPAANSMHIGEARLQLSTGSPLTTSGVFGGGQLTDIVPEPSSTSILCLTFSGLLAIRKRRQA